MNKTISKIENLTCQVNINKDGSYSLGNFINQKKHLVTINNPSQYDIEELQNIIIESEVIFDKLNEYNS